MFDFSSCVIIDIWEETVDRRFFINFCSLCMYVLCKLSDRAIHIWHRFIAVS